MASEDEERDGAPDSSEVRPEPPRWPFEQSLRILEAASQGVWIIDVAGATLYVNPKMAELLGRSVAELAAADALDHLAPVDARRPLDTDRRDELDRPHIDRSGLSEAPEHYTVTVARSSGETAVLDVHLVAITDRYGRPDGIVAMAYDTTDEARLRQELARSQAWLSALVEHAIDAVVVAKADATVEWASERISSILGRSAASLVGTSGFDHLHPDDLSHAAEAFSNTLAAPGVTIPLQVRLRHSDGTWRDVELVANNRLDDPSVGGVVFYVRDISERVRMERALAERESWFTAIVEGSSDAVLVVDADRRGFYASPAMRRVLGYELTFIRRCPIEEVIHPHDRERVLAAWSDLISGTGAIASVDVRVAHADGSWRHLEVTAHNRLDDAAVAGVVLYAHDITDRKEMEGELAFQALHDNLTGLANRRLFLDRVAMALARARRRAAGPAVLFVDLDRFKIVNDALGHAAGDDVLAAVASRLSGVLRPGDAVARIGGDEFAILCEVDDVDTASAVAGRVINALSEPIAVAGTEVRIGASVGIALGDPHADEQSLLRDADAAMYAAKRSGSGSYRVFGEAMRGRALERLEVERRLHQAGELGQIDVHYQPQLRLADGVVVGVEAVMRWHDPERGIVPAAEFVGIAEADGLIAALDTLVIGRVARDARAIDAAAGTDGTDGDTLSFAVNVSDRTLATPQGADAILASLADVAIPASRFVIEVTATMGPHAAAGIADAVARLRAAGVGVALDHFGASPSGLASVRALELSQIKVDRSCMGGVEDAGGRKLVAAIAAVGRALELTVAASGVETAAQARVLGEVGVQQVQGNHWCPPRPLTELVTWLADRA